MLFLLPLKLRQFVGKNTGLLLMRYSAKRQLIARINLSWCFPSLSQSDIKKLTDQYSSLAGQILLDYGLLWWGSKKTIERRIKIRNDVHIATAIAAGKNIILLTQHGLALDFGATGLALKYPLLGLMKASRSPLIDYFVSRSRTRFNGVLFEKKRGIRSVVKAIQSKQCFYYLPDEDHGPKKSVFAPFFGVQTATVPSLGKLSKLTDAVVIPVTTSFDETSGCYQVDVFPPLDDFPEGDALKDAAVMNQSIESMIRQAPAQYMWTLRIFRTRPEGEASPY